MEFNFSKFWSEQFFGFYQFKSFCAYAEDEESQIAYYNRMGAWHVDGTGEMNIVEPPQPLLEGQIDANKAALEMIKNHIIVFLFSKYEFVVKDTMKCLICDRPEKMIRLISEYPDYKDILGFSLKEFVKCESKEEYVSVLSERLISQCLSGKPTDVMKRLNCLLKFENINTGILDDLMEKRNNIVHESKIYELSLDDLETYYRAIENLLKNLALALKKINITVVDYGGLLEEEKISIEY